MKSLILTNGDVAADLLAEAGMSGCILPWRDILHEGPLGAPNGLEAFSENRAIYLATRFRLDPIALRADFAERDRILRGHADFDRIEIWLEHDLYDQLQLLQILSFFAGERRTDGLVLVQADDFLGHQTPGTILKFADNARPVDLVMLDMADQLWRELGQPTPEAIARHSHAMSGILGYVFPYLAPALSRFLAELPAPGTGLSWTESIILAELDDQPQTVGRLFHRAIASEAAPFMGDLSFFRILEDMSDCTRPLVSVDNARFDTKTDPRAYGEQDVELTETGRSILAGKADHVLINGVERWWAGTRLTSSSCWRYDQATARLISPPGQATSG